MSLTSWKKEFYPITARSAARLGALASAKHSLQKWIGLRDRNIMRHGLVVGLYRDLVDRNMDCVFSVDSDSCALCARYLQGSGDDACGLCPLYQVRGGVPCDNQREDEEKSPYSNRMGSPEPMIRWLRRTVRFIERGKFKEPKRLAKKAKR